MSVRKNSLLYVGGFLLIALIIGGAVLLEHSRSRAEAHEATLRKREVAAGPHVLMAVAVPAKTEQQLSLQGEARPFAEVTLYAKISGYLKSIRVDKGDNVKKDQLLAIIESPEIDRQYEGAMADAHFKRANAQRSASLVKGGFIAPRDAEQDSSQALIAEATVAAISTQKSYEQLTAPFDGTITARFADPGALMQSAVSAQTGALPVVTVSQLDRLRVYAYVDQRTAALVHRGNPVEVNLPGSLSAGVPGQVTRLSDALDARTRMMLVEVDLDNRERRIVPGSFVNVVLTISLPPAVEIPVEALVVRGKQNFVAHLGDDKHIHFRPVTLSGNDGARVRVSQGLRAGETVGLDVGNTVDDGAAVQPMFAPK